MLYFCTAEPTGMGRVDRSLLSDQVYMELLVSDFDDVGQVKDKDGNFLEIDSWRGLEFDENGNVCRLLFDELPEFTREMGLEEEGFGGGGTIHFQWVPPKVVSIDILSLLFEGTLDTSTLPKGLLSFDITRNQISGPFCVAGLPECIQLVRIQQNKFTGNLDLHALPKSILDFYVSGNMFSGSVQLDSLPQSLLNIDLSRNTLSGCIDIRSVPKSVRRILLHYNEFSREKICVEVDQECQVQTIKMDKHLMIAAQNPAISKVIFKLLRFV